MGDPSVTKLDPKPGSTSDSTPDQKTDPEDKPRKKILVLGLDNSGKTSIILSLKGTRNLMSFYSLKPTTGVHYDSYADVEEDFYIWDLGGQADYRAQYPSKMRDYVKNTDQVVFVIDVQDTARYDEALEFFHDIISALGDAAASLECVFYLHKYDPEIEDNPAHPVNQALEELIARIATACEGRVSHAIFKTSIYTRFRKIPVTPPG